MTESECNAVGLNQKPLPFPQRSKLTVSYASRYPSYARIPSIIMIKASGWWPPPDLPPAPKRSKSHGGPYCEARL